MTGGGVEEVLFRPGPIIRVQNLFGQGHADVFRVLTQLGTTWGVVLVVGLALWLWGRRDAYAVVGIVVVQAVVSFGLNQLLGVSRPDAPGVIKYEEVQVGSFPSGHVFLVTVLWGLLHARRRIPGWLAALVVFVAAVSRIYLGVHYLADVVAGALGGVLLVWGYGPLWRWAEPRLARWPAGAWVALGGLAMGAVAVAFVLGFYGDNPFKWHTAGLVFAGTPALLLEQRYVRHEPAVDDVGTRVLRLVLALIILVPLAWVDRAGGESPYMLGAMLIALGAVWGWLLAPAWFVRVDVARTHIPGRRDRAWHAARTAAVSAAAVVTVLFAYGTVVEPRLFLDVEHQSAPIAGLPAQWEGRRIAALGDFQAGMWWDNPGMMRRALARAIEARPAAVLLLGDFVYRVADSPDEELEVVRTVLEPLARSGIPAFAVLGNHDWGLESRNAEPDRETGRAVRQMLESLGFRVLHNEAYPLAADGNAQPLWIVGVASHYLGEDRPAEAVTGVPPDAPRFVFMHHPESFEGVPSDAAPVAAAGHTHGGQIALPFTPDWSWLTFARGDEPHADGWIEDGYGAPGNRLYVNRGIGMSVLPVRIGAAPELTLFTLTAR